MTTRQMGEDSDAGPSDADYLVALDTLHAASVDLRLVSRLFSSTRTRQALDAGAFIVGMAEAFAKGEFSELQLREELERLELAKAQSGPVTAPPGRVRLRQGSLF